MAGAPDKNTDGKYVTLAFRIIGEFGAIIAVPVVLLAWLGKRLDARYGTSPWLLIAGFVLAAALSVVAVQRRAKAFGREYEALGQGKK